MVEYEDLILFDKQINLKKLLIIELWRKDPDLLFES
jgi:hypothetical protein